jgi:hypothetical protein
MAQSGLNLAVTEDGAAYNKLRRPDDYLQSLTTQYPPKPTGELPPAKRKFEAVAAPDARGDGQPNTKRSREEKASKRVKENGMQTMFPGLDDDSASDADADASTRDALAYLRSVR